MGRKRSQKAKPDLSTLPEYTETLADLENLSNDSEDEFHLQRDRLDVDPTVNDNHKDSDVEVFGLEGVGSSSEDEDEKLLRTLKNKGIYKENVSDDESEEEEEQEDGGWGKARKNYYDADDVSDDEEDAKEEEKEALRLQKAHYMNVQQDDFLEDSFENLIKVNSKPKKAFAGQSELDDEIMATEKIKPDLSRLNDAEKLKLAEETLPDIAGILAEFENVSQQPFLKSSIILQCIWAAYLTNLSFFLAFAAKNHNEPLRRKKHPVVDQLAALKDLLMALSASAQPKARKQAKAALMQDEMSPNDSQSNSSDSNQDSQSDSEESATTNSQTMIPVESYDDIELPAETVARIVLRSKSDFGEGQDIDKVDMLDKMRRKKSLKFHVNQIDQSVSNNKSLKRKLHAGGDEDIPHRDFKASQQAAMQRSQASVGGSDDLDDDEEFDFGDDAEGEALYEQMKAEQEAKRVEKKQRRKETYSEIQTTTMDDSDRLAEGEKRKATWKILANKGLTPHRKKENRNPRVKKRIKYDKAKKRLSSYRRVAVDKAKLGRYGGEATGIKANLSRSVKFT